LVRDPYTQILLVDGAVEVKKQVLKPGDQVEFYGAATGFTPNKIGQDQISVDARRFGLSADDK
jgi:hypothetical protein